MAKKTKSKEFVQRFQTPPIFEPSFKHAESNYVPVKSFKLKRSLSESEEFEILKIVLDKFLWLGTALFGWGLYVAISSTFEESIYFILSGIVFMFLFSWIVVKEFEQRR